MFRQKQKLQRTIIILKTMYLISDVLNRKIELNVLNLPIESFKVVCKKKFLL